MGDKVIQIQTQAMGDNCHAELKLVTTVLYESGEVYEGSREVIGGDYNNGFEYGMVWEKLELPK